jgi:hypothetical protein
MQPLSKLIVKYLRSEFALTPLHRGATVKWQPFPSRNPKLSCHYQGRATSAAPRTVSTPYSREASLVSVPSLAIALRFLLLVCAIFACSIPAYAQFQQPFVFAADPANPLRIDVYTRNDLTGVLTPVPGSPFPSKETVDVLTLDFKGRFLFTASYNPSKISMFTVDPNTGALQEVPNSPFASLFTNSPVFLSTDSSGQFLYVINFNGSKANVSSVESFQIDPVNLYLIPSSAGATDLPGLFLSGATHPSGKSFYAFLNNPQLPTANQAFFLLFDSFNGTFTMPNPNLVSSAGTFGCCFALDPQGQHLALGVGTELTMYSVQADGTLGPPATGFLNGELVSMSFDTFGRFLYADLTNPPTNPDQVHIFSTSSLAETPNSPLPSGFPFPEAWTIDPTAPLIYADQVYQVDPLTGVPGSILPVNPFGPAGSGIPRAIFSQPPGSQPILGPIALLSATSLSFGSLSIGQTSSAQTLTITSDGGQALSLNTLTITGTNPGDFAITSDTCQLPTVLQPGKSCTVLVSFAPTATGSRMAAVTITSNASPTMESAQLNGTGLPPAPTVTLVPGTINFGTVTQGTSTPSNVSVSNSGTAPLHVSNISIGGPNANDFSFSAPTCNAAVPVNSTCTITVTFTPLAPGVRSAIVTLTDDAPDSPQTINVTGDANPAFTPGPAPNGSTTATVSAGQPAQY